MITLLECNNLVSSLLGFTISLPWHGYGSAIFLEIGELQPLGNSRKRHQNGEACIMLEWDWRIESMTKIICGSSNSGPKIEKTIPLLLNLEIIEIKIDGRLPELTMQFDNGYILRSMAMVSGDPQWNIRLLDNTWLSCVNGELIQNNGEHTGSTTEEDEVMEYSRITAQRWGTPISEPLSGYCWDCKFFVRIDGHFSLLDYGVCTSPASPFDGRATNRRSGCHDFVCE